MEHVGTELKVAREKRNVSLGQVAEATRISHTNLERLEEGRYMELPGGVYNRAFIRAYCEYLGLESKEMLARYEEETAPLAEKPYRAKDTSMSLREPSLSPHPLAAWGVMVVLSAAGLFLSRHWIANVFSPYFTHPAANKIAEPSARPTTPPETKPQPADAQPVSEAATAPAPQGGGVSAAPEKTSPIAATSTQPSSPPSGKDPIQPTSKEAAVPSVKPGQTQGAERPPGKLRLEVQISDKCWVSVNSDGNRALSQTLEPGSHQVFDADDHFFLLVGNAGGIHLKINGRPVRTLGKPGEVVRVLINESNLKDLVDKSPN